MRKPLAATLLVLALAVAGAAPAAAASPTCHGYEATIIGTDNPERITGTSGNDVIVAGAGSDRIEALAGDDVICAGAGHDVVYAGEGHDRILGETGDDWIDGSDGWDVLTAGPGDDELHGGVGTDRLMAGKGDDLLKGGDWWDVLSGGSGADRLEGGKGADYLFGGSGPDKIYGGGADDRIDAGRGRDHVDGGPLRDRLILIDPERGIRLDLAVSEYTTTDGVETQTDIENVTGTRHPDVLLGNAEDNVMQGGPGYYQTGGGDLIHGRAGHDTLTGSRVYGGPGNDHVSGREARGGPDDDVLRRPYDAAAQLWGEGGNDVFSFYTDFESPGVNAYGGPGEDRFGVRDACHAIHSECGDVRLTGGDGADRFHAYRIWGDARDVASYRFDLPAGLVSEPVHGLEVHVNDIEEVVGSYDDDTIIGTDGPEYLMGGSGSDTIKAGGGTDVLAGGTRAFDGSSDNLDGGAGPDLCYTSSPPTGIGPADVIERCEMLREAPAVRLE